MLTKSTGTDHLQCGDPQHWHFIWRPDHPWPGSGTRDSRGQCGTLSHWDRAGTSGCCDRCVHQHRGTCK